MSSQCSVALLEGALAGDLQAEDESSLHRHLEACEACCAELERMAGGPAWRQEAATLLNSDELDAVVPTRDEWSAVDFTVEHLEPADEPNVLGRLGGYDVLEIIGHGGMGVVLKAFDRELKRPVAIKLLAPHLAQSPLARKRFAREAQAAAAVVHPHVLAIHQVQASGRLPFLVMPLVAGESLAERLTAQGRLELKETLRIGMQAAAGLAAAHEQGLVHRDVKPANILLERGVERAVLTDFGLARAADDVALTRWGIIAGTPQYMSPEQARGEPLDGRSDLFSLGCVLYEMATGVSPFCSDSIMATMRRLVDDSPEALEALNPELPPWFIAIVERLLEKDPSQRFNSAREVSELLEGCLAHVQQPANVPLPAGVPGAKPTASAPHCGRHRGPVRWAGAIAAILLVGIGGARAFLMATAEPSEISGEWTGEGWDNVVLHRTGSAEYRGTYTDTIGKQPGKIELKWSRIERRYKGTWSEGKDRFGKISVRQVGDEIRGAWSTDRKSRINPATPELADLLWVRPDKVLVEQNGESKRQRFEPVEGQAGKTSWAVFQPPSLFSKTDWAVMARMTIGGEARIKLPGDQQPRCMIKLLKGSDEAIAVQVQDAAKKSKTIVSIARDQSAEVTVDGAGYRINYSSVYVAPKDPDTSPFAQVIVRRVENQGELEAKGEPSKGAPAALFAPLRDADLSWSAYRLECTLSKPRHVVLGVVQFIDERYSLSKEISQLGFYMASPDDVLNARAQLTWFMEKIEDGQGAWSVRIKGQSDSQACFDRSVRLAGKQPFFTSRALPDNPDHGPLLSLDPETTSWEAVHPERPFWLEAGQWSEKTWTWNTLRLFEARDEKNRIVGCIQLKLMVCRMLPDAEANWTKPLLRNGDWEEDLELKRVIGTIPIVSEGGNAAFSHRVPFEIGATLLRDGDRITIDEVRGTADTMKVGHLYEITRSRQCGRSDQNSRNC